MHTLPGFRAARAAKSRVRTLRDRLGILYLVGIGSALAAACATTGSTLGSGVGDAFLEHPPYYAGSGSHGPGTLGARVGHVPVAYQRGASQPAIFDPSHTRSMTELLDRMNTFLDSLDATVSLQPVTAGTPPDVHFGCMTESGMFGDDCAERGDSALGRKGQRMQLAVGRPSTTWITSVNAVMDEGNVDRVVVVTVEVGQYLLRQRGFRGIKELELGTDHIVRLPWLTSLETPVSVVQLTGALVGRDGKALRIGAEGLLARRTTLPLSSIGAQTLITDEDIAQLLEARRDDLPGAPLVWQVGLRNLVRQLLGRGVTVAD